MTTHDPDTGPTRLPSEPVHVALAPERDVRRDLVHAAVALVAWIGFARLWWDVAVSTSSHDILRAVLVVALIVAVVVPVNFGWIAHNVAIFRRKGPRTGLRSVELEYDRDWTGRQVVADDDVRTARLVEVDLVDDVKTLRAIEPHEDADRSLQQAVAA